MQPGMPQGSGGLATAPRSSRCRATRSARWCRSRCSSGHRCARRWGCRTRAPAADGRADRDAHLATRQAPVPTRGARRRDGRSPATARRHRITCAGSRRPTVCWRSPRTSPNAMRERRYRCGTCLHRMTRWPDAPARPRPNPTTRDSLSWSARPFPRCTRPGLPFVAGSLGVAAVGRRHRWLRTAGLVAAAACAVFFRHPPRVPPTRPGVVVAPADGQITLIDHAAPPAELGLPDTPMPRISIFLSVFDAHVQRVPVGGEVIAVEYRAGPVRLRRPRPRQRRQRAQQHVDPHARRGRRRGGADRRAAGPPHRLRRQDRRQADARRDLRADPVRVAPGHLPARRRPPCSSRPASGRSAAKPCWPNCHDQAPRQAPTAGTGHPAQRDDGAGDLPRIDVGQVRARRPADGGDGAARRRRDPRRARRPHRPGARRDVEDGRGDRLAGRRRQLRCRTGVHRLRDAAGGLAGGLDRGAALRGVHRAAAGPVQRAARRGPARLREGVLRRHARARPVRSARSVRSRPNCSSATAGGRRTGPSASGWSASRCWWSAPSRCGRSTPSPCRRTWSPRCWRCWRSASPRRSSTATS